MSVTAVASGDSDLQGFAEDVPVTITPFDHVDGPSSVPSVMVQDSSGKIYVGGGFKSYDDTAVSYIARLNSDGSLDTSFAPVGSGFNARVTSIAIQSDGKILVGGGFTAYNGTSRRRMARLETDGSLDSTFSQTGSGLNDIVYSIALQSDGKVVVGGNFISYNGTSRRFAARLNSNGTLDGTFALTGSGFGNYVNTLLIQTDGKIVVGGSFGTYNGATLPYVARLNSNGTLDASFSVTGAGFGNYAISLSLQSDDKIVVGGNFTDYNATSRPYVARLNSDGTLDTTFATTGTGLDNYAAAFLQGDGKVLLAGGFLQQ